MKSQNIISIHLTRFKSVEDFQNLLDDNGIKNIDAKKLFEHKEAGYTKNVEEWLKFINKVNFGHTTITHNIFDYEIIKL
jgi:hypothetical protein